MEWEKGDVRRTFRMSSGEEEARATPGLLSGPFGLVKDDAGSRRAPWLLIEQATGRLVAGFKLKCNALACAAQIRHHWDEESGEIHAGHASALWLDMQATLRRYGHSDRRVREDDQRDRQQAGDVPLAPAVAAEIDRGAGRSEAWRAPVTWCQIEAWCAHRGWCVDANRWLIGAGESQSVQALVTLDPGRRQSMIMDCLEGIAQVCGESVDDLTEAMKDE